MFHYMTYPCTFFVLCVLYRFYLSAARYAFSCNV